MAEGRAGYEVIMEERSLVKPPGGASRNGESLYLSSLDLCWRHSPYRRRLLFYDSPATPTLHADIVRHLKSSLAQLLLPFYPAAGRLATPRRSSSRPSLLCNGHGVELLVARVNAPLSSLRSSHFQPRPFFHLLAPPSYHSLPRHPLLAFQINKFLCGGLAIGISCSKVLADGHSMWHLMNSWAECARNEAISIPPLHNREVFKVDSPSNELASKFSLPTYKTPTHEDVAPSSVPKLLQFSSQVIYELKQEAYEKKNGPLETTFSDYDILCAQMWRCVMEFQAYPKLDDELAIISVLGDMRFRMKPQLPRGYFGNATIFSFASSLVRDLKSGSFGTTAQKIHEACKSCNEARLWTIVNWLELHDNMFEKGCLPWMVTCLNVVSSPKFKVYDVDFGFGKPIAVRTIHVQNTQDMVLLPSYKDGIDLFISLPSI